MGEKILNCSLPPPPLDWSKGCWKTKLSYTACVHVGGEVNILPLTARRPYRNCFFKTFRIGRTIFCVLGFSFFKGRVVAGVSTNETARVTICPE